MSAEEIVGALRICNRQKGHRCSNCPVFSRYEHGVCKRTVDRAAADLIESQAAEIAKLLERVAELEGQLAEKSEEAEMYRILRADADRIREGMMQNEMRLISDKMRLQAQLSASRQEESSCKQVTEWLECNGFRDFEAFITAYNQVKQREQAAVEELSGLCWCCVNGKKWDKAPGWSNMTTCEHMRERGLLAAGGGKAGKNCPHWQWRGPQEAGEEKISG